MDGGELRLAGVEAGLAGQQHNVQLIQDNLKVCELRFVVGERLGNLGILFAQRGGLRNDGLHLVEWSAQAANLVHGENGPAAQGTTGIFELLGNPKIDVFDFLAK